MDSSVSPRRTRPSRRKTKSGFCACAITFQPSSTCLTVLPSRARDRHPRTSQYSCPMVLPLVKNNNHHYVTPAPLRTTSSPDIHSSTDWFLMQLKCCRIEDLYGDFYMTMSIDYFSLFFFHIYKNVIANGRNVFR